MSETEDAFDGINIIAPPIRKINFAGELVEIAFVPSRADLEFNRIIGECKAGRMNDFEGFSAMVDIILSICTSNSAITRDWLLDHTDFNMMIEFFAAAKGKSAGNAEGTTEKKLPLGKSSSK